MERTRELSKRTKELEEIKGANETYLAAVERRYGEETALYRKRSGKRKGKNGQYATSLSLSLFLSFSPPLLRPPNPQPLAITHGPWNLLFLPPSVPLCSFIHPFFLSLFLLPCCSYLMCCFHAVDANLLRNEMEILRSQGDQQASLVVEEIKTRSMSTQKLLEGRLREEAEISRRLAVRNRYCATSINCTVCV